MEIKEYYKYYLGCEVHAKEGTMTYTLRQLGDDGKFALFKDKHGNEMWLPPNEWKMCLRRLSSIKEDEMKECGNMYYDFSGEPDLNKWQPSDFEIWLGPLQFHWLIKKGFWIFGDEAFEKGLIIEKK